MARPPHQGTGCPRVAGLLRRTGEKARRSSRTVMTLPSAVIWPGVSRKRRWMVSGVAGAHPGARTRLEPGLVSDLAPGSGPSPGGGA